jgi:benzylsuccinate CoA-transferase BbsF subunit/naphthyl-2-methylsuccinate CoA transferase subunit
MAALQAVSVAAGVARPPHELFHDAHLVARDFWQYLDRPFTGPFPQSALPFREGGAAYRIRTPAPTMGQHTTEVLQGVLGYGVEKLADLAARKITGTEAMPPGGRGTLR